MHITLRVAIADDGPLNLLDLREMLQRIGHEVVASSDNGHDILRKCRACKPDLAILDIRMPGLDGLEVARTLALKGVCPTIIVSAFSDQELIEEARESGCLSYLVKPIRPADLGPAIAVAMALNERLGCLQSEVARVQRAFEDRKFMDRAKGVLQTHHGLTEVDSYRYIQLRSMDTGSSMRDVSIGVINGEFEPNWRHPEPDAT